MNNLSFAAINIGAICIDLVIYEISEASGIKVINQVRHFLRTDKNTYVNRELDNTEIEEICVTLNDFTRVMKEYGVTEYRAISTSSLREATNRIRVVDRIKVSTGLDVEVLSNSEERFIGLKAVAMKDQKFGKIIEKSTALVDVGSGNVQVSMFDNGALVTTQTIRLGALRVNEILASLSKNITNYLDTLYEYIDIDMSRLSEIFFKDKKIHNVIFTGDIILYYRKFTKFFSKGEYANVSEFKEFYRYVCNSNPDVMASEIGIPVEIARLMLPSAMAYKRILDITKADEIWMPGTMLCDGVVIEYADKAKLIKVKRSFENDILAAAKNISKRYSYNKQHIKFVEENSLKIFDTIEKYHGLGERERLLLRIACILHDCGQYINMLNPGECSYNIIMSTEIIGLSHLERKMIASIVKYNSIPFDSDDAMWDFDKESYLKIAKLTAILRVGNAIDRSHKQKFKKAVYSLEEGNFIITAECFEDITLERAYLADRSSDFEEIFGLKPVIRQIKDNG